MAEIAFIGNVFEEAEGADWADGADRADGTDETDAAEMALRTNALFYFDCLGHKECKNLAYNKLWEPYAVTWLDGWDGWDIRTDHTLRLLRLLEHLC